MFYQSKRHFSTKEWRFLKSPRTVGIVGVPFNGGQSKVGVDQGPVRMLNAGLKEQVQSLGWNVLLNSDFQKFIDLNPKGLETTETQKRVRNSWHVGSATKEVAERVRLHQARGEMALTLGGDHSVAIGTVSGTASVHPEFCCVWVDAHADINTPYTSQSGNLHGCVLSFLLGLGTKDISGETMAGFEWVKPVLTPDRLVYIGLRDVDPGEKEIIKRLGIKAFSMHEVDRYGIGRTVEMALDHVNPNRDLPIHMSFDIDALDPSEVPSTGTPVRGGLTFREAHFLAEFVSETGLMVAFDLMELNPALGNEEQASKTTQNACSLVRAAMGETLL